MNKDVEGNFCAPILGTILAFGGTGKGTKNLNQDSQCAMCKI